jgi:hypothetical protein
MQLVIELNDDQAAKVQKESERLGISAEELVKAGLNDWMNRSQDDFQNAADYVLSKNAELYNRF